MPLTEEQKEQKKEYNKKYQEENKEKIKKYKKEYYEENKEKIKEYREQNKEKIKEYKKEYYEEHKEKIKEEKKEYNEANKEKRKECNKKYIRSENGKKSHRISGWKINGVISDDFNALYEKYINTNECEICNVAITSGRGIYGKKHLDHCHITGEFRNILCGDCNVHVMRKK